MDSARTNRSLEEGPSLKESLESFGAGGAEVSSPTSVRRSGEGGEDGGSGDVAVVIPAYQAARWVGDVVTEVLAPTTDLPDLPLLVIDDGSDDGTDTVAREAGAEVLRLAENRGKGHALRFAFRTLFDRGYGAVITLDADGQHMPSEIPKLIARWRESGADLVLGTREHLFAGMSPLRRFANTLSSRLISAVAGQMMLDIQTGFRLYTRGLIATTGFPEDRFEAESAVVVRALLRGLEVATVPIDLAVIDGRSSSHYRPLVDSGRIARAVARARFERF